MTRAGVSILLLVGLAVGTEGPLSSAPRGWIWWEAETPRSGNFPADNPFQPAEVAVAKALSGGKWIGAVHPGKALFLEYAIEVPKGADYSFYARKFWRHGPFKWRFDGQPWRECPRDVPLLDDAPLAKFVNVNWVPLGAVKLAAGKHTVRIELPADTEAVAFDCFLLIDGPFEAHGRMKPGEKYGVAPAGWFPFEPDPDPFGDAALDLRFLNEKAAGDGGFIQARGDSFVHQKTGQSIRFWAINVGHEVLAYDDVALDGFARHLAKFGVNMVRLHGPLWREDDPSQLDGRKLAGLHRLVAALKRQGIYLALSSYFPVWLQPKAVPGLDGYGGDKSTFAIAFFNPRFQEIQKGWWRDALTAKSPQSGLTLLQDPTLAFIEIQNEDSLFFWTFSPYDNVPAPQMELLERQFGDWLKARYGGIGAALAHWNGKGLFGCWGGTKMKGDLPAAGRVGVLPPGEILSRRDGRAQDTAEFLAALQRRFYDQTTAYLKRDLGFKGSVTGSNWITADARVLGPLDKWSNAGCDFMDRHGYYGGPHEGERAGYLLSDGDRYNDASALRFETGKGGQPSFELPLMDLAYNGKPSTISEINWAPPNRYRAEMSVLAAAYGSLQGSDAFFFFAGGELGWADHLTKFSISDPAGVGQFPAAALIFRQGLVRTGELALRLEAKLSDLYALRGIPVSAPQNLDGFRKKDLPAGQTPGSVESVESIDPLAFLTGRVEVNVTATGGISKMANLSGLIDRQSKIVRSATGELRWDYGRGLVTIDAPAAQGATGFLSKAGTIALGDVTIASRLEYGSILVVSLDDRPLKTSGRMLLQVMSEDNNFGWSAPGTGLRAISDVGGPPIVVKKLEGEVSLKRADAPALRVSPLDDNGYRTAVEGPIGGGRNITLRPTTLYYLIEAGARRTHG